ncbi:hypothetical protein WS58_00635 [Burkholderia pseudomultivorans]|nr:hypothetical protein WS58_00635 [Burkholderia pseudomultivorans]
MTGGARRRELPDPRAAIIALKQRSSDRGIVRFGLPEDYAELWLPDLLKSFYALRPGARLHAVRRLPLGDTCRFFTGTPLFCTAFMPRPLISKRVEPPRRLPSAP